MAGYRWISFTTDYGRADGFVAACHGVIARIAPQVRVIDVSHDVAPGDVARAAALLAQTVPYLPPAVHVSVVDPGVGTERRGIAIETTAGVLVGPDNGVLTWAADALGGPERVVSLTNQDWFVVPVSRTFHGRDVFAPVAARIAAGAPVTDAGPTVAATSLVRLPEPVMVRGDGWLETEVLTVDRFGNVQLAADATTLADLAGSVTVNRVPALRGATFADARPGGLVVLVDSAGQAAVALNGGRANVVLGVGPGDLVRIERAGAPAATAG